MALEDIQARAKLATAQLDAQLGAVDHPAAGVYKVLGIRARPGLAVYDTITGETVEVVDVGVMYVNPDNL